MSGCPELEPVPRSANLPPTFAFAFLVPGWGGGSREQWAWGFSAHLAAFAREAIPKHPVGVIGTSRTPV